MCVCFTTVWKIKCWTRDRQPLTSPQELRAHRNGVISHIKHPHPHPFAEGGRQ